ncbi:MAG: DNA-binding protein Alba [Candidatus Marsarchaeota archaeon]|jgi:DNA-binding protein|nr:DNA-binding protein Alba [Candidatus Marsarchaeota archaeon]
MNEIPQQNNEKSEDGNIIYIGRKPTMNYVLAVVTQFNSGASEVVIKARGNSISKAVDVKEIVTNRFMQNLNLKGITTSSEELTNEDGTKSKVSAIQIVLAK